MLEFLDPNFRCSFSDRGCQDVQNMPRIKVSLDQKFIFKRGCVELTFFLLLKLKYTNMHKISFA